MSTDLNNDLILWFCFPLACGVHTKQSCVSLKASTECLKSLSWTTPGIAKNRSLHFSYHSYQLLHFHDVYVKTLIFKGRY